MAFSKWRITPSFRITLSWRKSFENWKSYLYISETKEKEIVTFHLIVRKNYCLVSQPFRGITVAVLDQNIPELRREIFRVDSLNCRRFAPRKKFQIERSTGSHPGMSTKLTLCSQNSNARNERQPRLQTFRKIVGNFERTTTANAADRTSFQRRAFPSIRGVLQNWQALAVQLITRLIYTDLWGGERWRDCSGDARNGQFRNEGLVYDTHAGQGKWVKRRDDWRGKEAAREYGESGIEWIYCQVTEPWMQPDERRKPQETLSLTVGNFSFSLSLSLLHPFHDNSPFHPLSLSLCLFRFLSVSLSILFLPAFLSRSPRATADFSFPPGWKRSSLASPWNRVGSETLSTRRQSRMMAQLSAEANFISVRILSFPPADSVYPVDIYIEPWNIPYEAANLWK